MAVKDILVHLDSSPRADLWLSVAATLAAKHRAHLTGLCIIDLPPPDVFYGFPSAFMDVQRAEDVVDRMREARLKEIAAVETKFRDRLRREGIEGEWRVVEGDTAEVLALHSRYADMTILRPARSGRFRPGRYGELSISTLMSCGRPLLVVPFAGSFDELGSNVLIGWNASAEAARAVNEAIPLDADRRRR